MLVFELSMSPGLVPCPTEGQLLKSRYFGGYTCQVWRTGQKITGGAFVEGGRALLRLSALWQWAVGDLEGLYLCAAAGCR